MWYVYIIRSVSFPEQEYIGATADLKRRLLEHNAGKSTYTAKFKPWKLTWYCAFPDKYKALAFEKYLKSHSGRAFANKRLCARSPLLAERSIQLVAKPDELVFHGR
jgi:predicted GIY-YIG superfamily endonuclease